MALSLSVVQPSGITVTYWKVSTINIDNINKTMNVVMAGYLDGPTQASGASPIVFLPEVIDPSQFITITTSSNIIAAFYTVISGMSDFTGSTIVA